MGSSILVAALVAFLVLQVWYPWPYREVSGGLNLLFLVMSVDLVMGPLITLAIYDIRKPASELRRDLAIIVVLQLAALSYGMHTVYQARPVVLALEGDRFRAVIAAEVVVNELPSANASVRNLSMTGPRLINTRKAQEGDERLEAILSAAGGVDLGMRPSFWLPWDEKARSDARRAGRQFNELERRYPAAQALLSEAATGTGLPPDQLLYIPMLARRTDWSVLIDKTTGDVVGFVPLDGF